MTSRRGNILLRLSSSHYRRPVLCVPHCWFPHRFMTTHCVTSSAVGAGVKDIPDAQWRQKLTPAAYRVLRQKATEPVGGPLDNFFSPGDYLCAGCRTPLYTSSMKFACGCGWPGFWDCLPGAVREVPDPDGHRTEIVCHACNSHLGHVFRGEGFRNPPPNERHCVNSISLVFNPAKTDSE